MWGSGESPQANGPPAPFAQTTTPSISIRTGSSCINPWYPKTSGLISSFSGIASPLLSSQKFSSTRPKPRRKRNGKDKDGKTALVNVGEEDAGADVNDAGDLAEFINVYTLLHFSLSYNMFRHNAQRSVHLRIFTYKTWTKSPDLQALYTPRVTPQRQRTHCPQPLTLGNRLPLRIRPPPQRPYALSAPTTRSFLLPHLHNNPPPPPPSTTKSSATGCELCFRDRVPLTYHHLIPKFVHEKALKRGWQPEERLNDVAWLCRACHSFVHRVAGHEELVREYYTVKRLRERDDVVAFAGWGGKVMWKAR